MRLPASAGALGTADFATVLKHELVEHADELPLQQALSGTSAVANEAITVVVLGTHADAAQIHVKVGVFFSGILAGCSCADDPTPIEPQPEYCELSLVIDSATAKTSVKILD